MTAVDQTGSGQADSAVQTGFAAVPVALAGPGYPAEQRGWTEPAVPVALTVAVRAERKAAVARVAWVARTGAALAELAVRPQVARVAWVARTGAVPVVLVAQAARSSSAGRIGSVSYTHLTLPTNREV